MSLVSWIVRMASSYPQDLLRDVENLGDKLRFKTARMGATITVAEAEELAAKFFELKIPRCSVYVGIVRHWLCQRNPKFINLTPFEEWLMVPWPGLKPYRGRERFDILTDDRIVNPQQIRDCITALSERRICGSRDSIARRLSQEGRDVAECWNEFIEEERKNGWVYAEEYSHRYKRAPHILNFDELPQHIQDMEIENSLLIDGFGIELRSKEAVEQEWANSWTSFP